MNFPKFNLLVVSLVGWFTQNQNRVIDFLMEENRTLHELLGQKRPKLNDRQRRRLAAKAKSISRKILQEICSLVTPDTLSSPDASIPSVRLQESNRSYSRLGVPI